MKLSQLIEELRLLQLRIEKNPKLFGLKEDQDAGDLPVCVSIKSGDYWKTKLAPELEVPDDDEAVLVWVETSAYHNDTNSVKKTEDRNGDPIPQEELEDGATRVILLTTDSGW